MGDGDDAPGDGVGEGRKAVDDDKGIANEGSFYGGGSAGDNRSAGVEKSRAGASQGGAIRAFGAEVVDQTDGEMLLEFADHFLCGLALGGSEGWSKRNDEFELRIPSLPMDPVNEENRGTDHLRQVVLNLPGPAPGKKSDPGLVRIQSVLRRELLAADRRQREIGEGMADKFSLYAALAIVGLFEGEVDLQAGDVALAEPNAALFPSP